MKTSKKTLLILLVLGALTASSNVALAALSFNPSSVTIAPGQSLSVNISGGDGNYYASANTNTAAAQLNLNGSTLTLTGGSNTGDTTNITICSAVTPSNCGTLTVTVSGSGSSSNNNNNSNNNSNINAPTFSQNNVTMAPNTTQGVTINGIGNYFISNVSNHSIVTASITNNTLNLTANAAGSATVTVCQSGGCGNVTVNVGGSSSGSTIIFSQTNPIVAPGNTAKITVSGGTNVYNLSNNSNPIALVATLSNNSLALTGVTAGTSILTVCDSGNICGSVTVSIANNAPTQTTPPPTTNTTSIPQSYAQALLSQILAMESQLSQFQNQLAQLKASIQVLISGNFSSYATPTLPTNSSVVGKYTFTQSLDIDDSGPEVTALQNYLTAKGYYSGPITGYYGSLTESAVKKFQAANGITAQGNVGPSTRAALNQ
ncbi:MAG: peptidoglycan-binding protein [Anaplasmataceae bacterium]|nr:peptidoglycan-binding protein [Anaplasmataceae bacterium]